MGVKPNYLPDNVRRLAQDMLAGLPLTSRQKSAINLTFGFSTFNNSIGEDEKILCDICDEMPTLAALILVRDTLMRTMRALGESDPKGPETPEVYLLMPTMLNFKRLLFSLALTACNKFPDMHPDGFKVDPTNGRLVLVGEFKGCEAIKNRVGIELAQGEEGGIHVIKVESLDAVGSSPSSRVESSDLLDEFTVKKKLYH